MKKATNSELMKKNNKKLILRLIMQGEYSRADISKITGLTKAAVSIITDDMQQMNMIFERESDYSGVGRKPHILSINKNRFYAVGVNITRKYYEVGIVNLYGEVIISTKSELCGKNPYSVLDEIYKIIMSQINMQKILYDDILGIGITTPGPVDFQNNKILYPPDFEAWHNTDFNYLKNKFEDMLSLYIENVANAAALYEKYYGKCLGESNYIVVLVDEGGIGSGIVINDMIYRGANGLGNEIGHMTIQLNGRNCKCGNRGCLERYASISEILKETPYKSWHEVVDKNDNELISRQSEYLCAALVGVINLLDLNTIIITGDLGYKGENICGKIVEKLNKCCITKKAISVIPSLIEDGVAVAGSIIVNDFLN